jgi:hypothetical protein
VKRIAKLVPPSGGKNWSFQVANRREQDIRLVRVAMATPAVKLAQPFLQGETPDWLMVEFWVRDKEKIVAACKIIARALSTEFVEGTFTTKDVFGKNQDD